MYFFTFNIFNYKHFNSSLFKIKYFKKENYMQFCENELFTSLKNRNVHKLRESELMGKKSFSILRKNSLHSITFKD